MERLTMSKGLCAKVSTDYCHQHKDCYECSHGREVFRRLSAYEDAEQAGRLAIFPCKVGEIVWLIDTRFFQRDKGRLPLVRCRVNEFSNDGKHTYMVLDGAERWYAMPRFRAVLIEEFGKVVFRTQDEAAAALTKKEEVEK